MATVVHNCLVTIEIDFVCKSLDELMNVLLHLQQKLKHAMTISLSILEMGIIIIYKDNDGFFNKKKLTEKHRSHASTIAECENKSSKRIK
jgi:hypothetical protein